MKAHVAIRLDDSGRLRMREALDIRDVLAHDNPSVV